MDIIHKRSITLFFFLLHLSLSLRKIIRCIVMHLMRHSDRFALAKYLQR